jgi:CBS domain-containing protein
MMSNNAAKGVIREDFINALKDMNTYIDITVDDLMVLNHKAIKYAALREKEAVPITSVMTTDVVTVVPELPLSDAVRLMVTEKISGLPVVDGAQQLIGIITEADLLRSIGLPSHNPSHTLWQTLETMFSRHHNDFHETREVVADLMVRNVIAVGEETSLHEVIDVMKKHKIKRVVVCDDNNQVKGIITRSNLVKVFFNKLTE